jgi:tripartite-type tricarboxylate transporter receptor subunit TctC
MNRIDVAFIAVAIAATCPAIAQKQTPYPVKPIRLVVAFTPGGTPDSLARLVAPKISENWKQPVVIENRPGAGGTIASTIVAQAPADGYTILAHSNGFAITAAMSPNLPYDPLKDFTGVASLGYSTTVLVVSPTLGVKSVKELIALANAQPGKVFFGSAGAGSGTHFNAERFRLAAGIKATHVAFKGQPEFLLEIVAGRVQFGVGGLGPSMGHIKEGRLIPLAVVLPQRAPTLPDVPAAPEVLPGWGRDGLSQVWLAPAGTPRPILDQLNREVARTLELPDIRERLQSYDFNVTYSTPDEINKQLRTDIAMFRKIGIAAGLVK